jgi:hypothetical protein
MQRGQNHGITPIAVSISGAAMPEADERGLTNNTPTGVLARVPVAYITAHSLDDRGGYCNIVARGYRE